MASHLRLELAGGRLRYVVEDRVIVSQEVVGIASNPGQIRRTQLTWIGGIVLLCATSIGVMSTLSTSRTDLLVSTFPAAFTCWLAIISIQKMSSRQHGHRFVLTDQGIRIERSWQGKPSRSTDVPWKNVLRIVQDEQGLTIDCAWGTVLFVSDSCWESPADASNLIEKNHKRLIKLVLQTTG